MRNEPIPLGELETIRSHFPNALPKEISDLWFAAPAVISEWCRYDYAHVAGESHPNIQAARLFYLFYALTPSNNARNRRKRQGYRVSAMMVLLPRWDVTSSA